MIAFENLKVTTMTLVIPLIGSINLDAAFNLLRITRIHLPQPKRQSQKYKIPHCTDPGAILSLRYKGDTRGIIRSTSSSHFKNSITIDIATKDKNVSIKLSSTKIQMCGASSVQQGIEGSNYIINQLLEIQDILDYIQSNQALARSTVDWIKENTRGAQICRKNDPVPNTVNADAGGTIDNAVQHPFGFVLVNSNGQLALNPGQVINTIPEYTDQFPQGIDIRIANFMLRQIFEHVYYTDYCLELDWILGLTIVTTRPLAIQQVHKAMVNYNYDLGFSVRRSELVRQINGLNGFYARYHNSIEHNVTIELPYEVPEQHRAMRKKNKNPCHIFLVYMSGLVTQSGPGEELMCEAYYRFNATINSIRDLIFKDNLPRTLKFKPAWAIPNKIEHIRGPSPDNIDVSILINDNMKESQEVEMVY